MNKFFLLAIVLFSLTLNVFAEGTPQIMPNPAIDIRFQVYDNGDPLRNFMTYGCPVNSRLNIRIKQVGNERIHIGLKQTDGDVYMRVRDPLGTIVYGPVLVPASGAGYINTYAQAIAGPSLVVGPTGYNSLYFTPSLPGDYYIEFNPKNANTYIAGTSNVKRLFQFFDISVEKISTKVIQKGRLWSSAWDFNCMSFTNPFQAKMHIYAPDSVLTAIDFNGIQPFGFVIEANSTGVQNTGNIVNDRRSVAGNKQYPEYKLFLQIPDTTIFVPGRLVPNIIGTPAVTGCASQGWKINLQCTHTGLADIYLNLNGVAGYQAGTADVFFNTKIAAGINNIPWNGNNGLGVAVTDGAAIPIFITYYAGLTHLPLYDCESHPNGFKVSVVAPPGGTPSTFWDDSGVGGTTNLAVGCVNGCHPWTGTFGDVKTLNTWWVTHYKNLNVVSVKYNKCPPTANPDSYNTALNTPITYSVVANDTDPGGSSLTIAIVTPPISGTATVVGGQIQYTPATNFSGTVTLIYQACNTPTLVLCDTAKVTIVVDCDDDGLSSAIEPAGDADGDGLQNRCDLDSDNDGILDSVEGYTDFDGDGIPNALDLDSDNDGITDAIEANSGVVPTGYDYTTGRITGADTDNDGLLNSVDNSPSVAYGPTSTSKLANPNTDGDARANYLDKDSDNDGIMDVAECGGIDANRDGVVDGFTDTDADGYNDAFLSAPLVVRNSDGVTSATNKVDYLDCDSDGDGISDNREGQTTAGFVAALAFADADGDGISNQYDGGNGIIPIDSNNDGVPDFRDTDSDNDGILDIIEGNDAATTNGVADTTPLNVDADGDGIDDRFDSNLGLFSANSNVPCQDFDGDGQRDWRDIDDDNDGVPTAMETGDAVPANGIKDYLEVNICGNHFVGQSSYAISVYSVSGVSTPTNGLNAPDGTVATFNAVNDYVTYKFNAAFPIGSTITFVARKTSNAGNASGLQIQQSTNGTTFSNPVTITNGVLTQVLSPYTYTTTVANVLYVRFDRTGNRGLEIDAIQIRICSPDQDNDGIPNSVDLDDDNDGLSDLQEGNLDSDGDGLINSLDLDSDNDGIPDAIEANAGKLPANMTNQGQFTPAWVVSHDTNLNGWVDNYDNFNGGTNLQDQDFDGDGKPNRIDLDSDSDGLTDAVEANNGTLPANMNNSGQYPAVFATANDSDGDGLVNAFDYSSGGVAIMNPDTDADTNKDFLDLDSDNDTLFDSYEANNGSFPTGVNTTTGAYPAAYVNANDVNGNGLVDALQTTPLANPDSDGNGKKDYQDKCLQSVANGTWNSAATWGGTIPTCGKCAMVSHSITITGQSYVSNVTVLPGGMLTNSTGTLNVCGNLAMSGGTLGTIGCTSKTILSGTINQKISGNWNFGTLELNNTAGATVVAGANVTILKTLILTKGTFSVAPTATFVLTGGTCGNAYVSGAGVGTFTGNATVVSTIGGCQGYVTLGAPYNTTLGGIKNLYYQGFTGTFYPTFWNNVYTYNEQKGGPSDSGYVKATNLTNVLPRGKGMVVYTFSNTITPMISSIGAVDLANFTFPLTYSTTSFGNLHDGFNLLANPYPAPIDWGTPASPGWTKVNCCDAIYSYNRCGNQFSAFVGGIAVNGGSGIIPAYQGFWVKAHTPTSSITINRNAIVGTQKAVYKTAATTSTYSILNAKIKTGVYEDELAIAFGDTAISNGLGSWYGACKMQTGEPNYPSFASWQVMPWDSYLMSINILPELKTKTVQLKTKTPKAGNYTITFSGLNTFDPNACIFLEDTLTGIYHDIRQDSIVNVTIGVVNYLSNRFVLHFNAPPSIKAINPSCVNSQSGLAIVASPYPNSTYVWKDATGTIVKQTNIVGYSVDSLSKIAAGNYMVEIQNNSIVAGSCSSSSVAIVIPESNNTLNVNTTITNPSMCNAINGIITTSITASNGACTYAWSNGATTPSVTVGDGTYQLQITDATGCMITKMLSVTAPISNYANYTTSTDTLIWPNATVSFTNTSFASTNYIWDFGDASSTSNNINETHIFAAPGTYNVSLTASTTNCTDTLIKQVVILSATGVNEINDFTNNISIYPNPNNGEFIIDYLKGVSSTHQILIMDILGKVVYSETISEHYKPFKAQIKLNGFEEGVYILRISNKDVKKDLKLILNK